MPADDKDLPSTLERSPDKIQRTYEKTLDSAEEQYDSEQRAHRTAWAAVKNIAEKQGDHWELKDGGSGPSDGQAERGGADARDRPARTYGGVDVNKPKAELQRDARAAGIKGRSRMTKDELAAALQRHNDRETARARQA
jgi:cation transport regulator ChaB